MLRTHINGHRIDTLAIFEGLAVFNDILCLYILLLHMFLITFSPSLAPDSQSLYYGSHSVLGRMACASSGSQHPGQYHTAPGLPSVVQADQIPSVDNPSAMDESSSLWASRYAANLDGR